MPTKLPVISLPPFYCPFEPTIHPGAEEAQDGNVNFLDRFGLFWDETQRQRMITMNMGRLCGLSAPRAASQDLLQIYTDLMLWAFAYDDEYCDEQPIGQRPADLALANARMQRIMESPEHIIDDTDRYGMALRDIRTRFAIHSNPFYADQLTTWWLAYLTIEVQKAAHRSTGTPITLNEFAPIRLHAGGGMTLPIVAVTCSGVPEMSLVTGSRRSRALLEIAATLLNWGVELFSYSKEQQRTGDGQNLIDILIASHDCPPDRAFHEAMALWDSIMALYLRMRNNILRDNTDELGPYVTTLDSYIRGGLQWSSETLRYRSVDGLGEKPAFVPGGWSDTPPDVSVEPVPVPSIRWWWHYDPARQLQP